MKRRQEDEAQQQSEACGKENEKAKGKNAAHHCEADSLKPKDCIAAPKAKQRKLTDFLSKTTNDDTNSDDKSVAKQKTGKPADQASTDATTTTAAAAQATSSAPNETRVSIFTTWATALGDAWSVALLSEVSKRYFITLCEKVETERLTNTVYPPKELVFNAFITTPLDKVKVVIVGQDPYHGPNQAMGLCFSVARGVKVPPSLVNIFKEIGTTSSHGDLSHWARQGVFLLNSLLTVTKASPMSHKQLGWEVFTDKVIDVINKETSHAVFMLWGKPAQQKGKNVDRSKHLVLEAGHPSPLSVRHFSGCGHFEKCNDDLRRHSLDPIDWHLPQ